MYGASLLVAFLLGAAACAPPSSTRQQETGVPTAPSQPLVIVEMERLFTQDVAALPIYYTPEVSAYVDGLLGPTTRLASEPSQSLAQVHTWEWHPSPGRR